MKSRYHRAAIDQIVAFILITFVTFVWILFVMIDYWSVIKIKDKLDILTQEAAHWLAEQPILDHNISRYIPLQEYLKRVASINHITVQRVSDTAKGEIHVEASTIYHMHNHAILGDKNISSQFHTFSLYDQNGSYIILFQ